MKINKGLLALALDMALDAVKEQPKASVDHDQPKVEEFVDDQKSRDETLDQ